MASALIRDLPEEEIFEGDGLQEVRAPSSSAAPRAVPSRALTADVDVEVYELNAARSFETFSGRLYEVSDRADVDCVASLPVVHPSRADEVAGVAAQLDRSLRAGVAGSRAAAVSASAAATSRALDAVGSGGRAVPPSSSSAASGSIASVRTETPLQRYHRLLRETAELEQQLTDIEAAGARRPKGATRVDFTTGVWSTLSAGITELHARLAGMGDRAHAASIALAAPGWGVGGGAAADATGGDTKGASGEAAAAAGVAGGGGVGVPPAAVPADSPHAEVLAKLQQLAASLAAVAGRGAAGVAAGAAPADGSRKPAPVAGGAPDSPLAATAAALSASGAAALDRRVAQLEASLGLGPIDGDDCARAAASGAAASVLGCGSIARRMDAMQDALQALDAGKMAAVTSQAAAATDALKALAAASAAGSAAASPPGSAVVLPPRLRAAVEALERWDSLAAVIPAVAARLATLHKLHSDAVLFPQRLALLEKAVTDVDAGVAADRAILVDVHTGLADAAKTLLANFAQVQAQLQGGAAAGAAAPASSR